MSKNYILDPSETMHFKHEGYLEFDELLTLAEREMILKAIENCASQRDLFLEQESLRTFYMGKLMRSLAKGLFPKRPLRIAFDWAMAAEEDLKFPLNELTCIQGIEMGVLFDLASGDVRVLGPEQTIPVIGAKQLLAGFANENALYKLNENDPYTHNLKSLGYVFGDKLKQSSHPLITKI